MNYINPYESDAQTIKNYGVLSRRQADMDFAAAKAERGFDAEFFSKGKFRVPEGFSKIPGASRSGALDPSTKSRFLNREARGEVELARNQYGELVGYRDLGHETGVKPGTAEE